VTKELYIGLMSGTSLDAVDAVVASIDKDSTHLIASCEHQIPDDLRQQVLAICTGRNTTLTEVGIIDHKLGKLFATVVQKLLAQAELLPEQITAIGNHGQTVFHQPDGESPFTMQLGDANLIAVLTGVDTIADFRRTDMALGGQGAPLVPAFHQHLFRQSDSTTVVLNIGGIANISVIPPDDQKHIQVTGFDTGPGNMLMDAWCEKHTGHKYDQDAQWARQGQVSLALLDQLMSDPYLKKTPPKSTGREHYNLKWLEQQITDLLPAQALPAQDVQRTLCEFTARSIAQQVQLYEQGQDCELLVCGGGASNPLLQQLIKSHLQNWRVTPTTDRGIPGDYIEAMAFAWLARQRVHNLPGNLPAVTGARCQASLGAFYPAVKDFS